MRREREDRVAARVAHDQRERRVLEPAGSRALDATVPTLRHHVTHREPELRFHVLDPFEDPHAYRLGIAAEVVPRLTRELVVGLQIEGRREHQDRHQGTGEEEREDPAPDARAEGFETKGHTTQNLLARPMKPPSFARTTSS
jgi:hypothetical protein